MEACNYVIWEQYCSHVRQNTAASAFDVAKIGALLAARTCVNRARCLAAAWQGKASQETKSGCGTVLPVPASLTAAETTSFDRRALYLRVKNWHQNVNPRCLWEATAMFQRWGCVYWRILWPIREPQATAPHRLPDAISAVNTE